ncbi:MAG: hypothetical protein ACREP6_10950 [Candidatus Binataceae bacterium]
MTPQQPTEDLEQSGDSAEDQRQNDSVANKLSEELSNWRRRRHTGTRHRLGGAGHPGGANFHASEPARTIKVRGHETLVIRKAKSTAKPPINPDPANQ